MTFRLLVWLKARLIAGSFSGKRSVGGVLSLLVLIAAFSPLWLGAAAAAYSAVRRYGEPAVVVVFVAVQASWIYVALLLGAFTEAFDLRRMLRYPVEPRAVYTLNVLATPFDLVAVLLLPPLVAVVAAAAAAGGAGACAAALVGAALLLLLTSALLQGLLALLADLLKHEWARAAGGLALGLGIFGASWALRGPLLADARAGTALHGALELVLMRTASMTRWLITASLPARTVAAATDGRWLEAASAAAGAVALGIGLVAIGARVALRAALERETRAVATAAAPTGAARSIGADLLDALLPPDLSAMVGRELRVLLRTPQILVGLVTTPLLIAFFFSVDDRFLPRSAYWAAFLTLMPALNLSANQFGLDREGIRTLLVLPLGGARLLLAKNVTVILLIGLETLVTGLVLALVGFDADPWQSLTALVGIFAVLPVLLSVGNVLSVRSPWRMTFKIGGAPRGAIVSAFAQIVVLAGMTLFLAAPIAIGRLVLGGGPLMALGGVMLEGVATWVLWALLLDGQGDALMARRERLVDVLARAEETG